MVLLLVHLLVPSMTSLMWSLWSRSPPPAPDGDRVPMGKWNLLGNNPLHKAISRNVLGGERKKETVCLGNVSVAYSLSWTVVSNYGIDVAFAIFLNSRYVYVWKQNRRCVGDQHVSGCYVFQRYEVPYIEAALCLCYFLALVYPDI